MLTFLNFHGMTDIFVSYATQDRERVRQLVSKLEEQGWLVWWDREIKAGRSFENEIEKAIESARCILVVWSHASVESEWVRTEANEGLDRRILVPVSIDDVRPPLAYRRLQTVFLIDWPKGNHEEEFKRLISGIKALLEVKDVPGKEGIAVERRHISVLTAVIHEPATGSDPETLHDQHQQVKEMIRKAAARFGGYLHRSSGSHFTIVFGVAVAHEEDTLQAVHLSLHLNEAMQAYPQHRMSISTSVVRGLVIVSKENTRLNEYTITGDVMDEGHSLLAIAAPGEMVMSARAYKMVANYVQAEERVVRDRKTYRVQSATAVTSRIEASEAKGFTEFFGREKEMARLLEQDAMAAAGSGQVVTLVGEAGIGKSRLLYEIRQRLPANERTLLEGRCQSHGRHTPYHPYLGMLRQYLRLTHVPPAELHNTAVQSLLTAFPELSAYIPHYLYLLSIPSEQYPLPAHLQGESMRLTLQDALVSILALVARQKPLVIILEDWHWADEASTGVLQHLIDVAVSLPILIVISCRPEYHPAWSSREHSSLIKISSFSLEQTHAIITRVVKGVSIPGKLAEDLHLRTGGNPFFIEELCTSLLEQKKIYVSDGNLVVKDGIENLELPDSIEAVLRNRLDQLDREAREVVQMAAVIGREFSRRLLSTASGKVVEPVLRALTEMGIINQTKVFPDPEYMFKHALIQMAAYETLLLKQRKKMHGLVANRMLELYPGAEHTETLAHHFSLSDDTENAIRYSMLAGERALARSAYLESLTHLKRAEQLLELLPDSPATQQLRLRNLLAKGPALIVTQGYAAPAVIETYQKASEYSRTMNANDLWFASQWGLWRYYYNSAMIDRATEVAYQLMDIGRQSNKTEEWHSAYAALITSETLIGNISKALEYLDLLRSTFHPEAEKILAIRYGLSPMVLGLCFGANSVIMSGNHSKGMALLEEAIAISQQIDHAGSEVLALFYSINPRLLRGNVEDAVRVNGRLLQIAREKKFPHWIALGEFNEARESMLTGGDLGAKLSTLMTKAHIAKTLVPLSVASSGMTVATVFITIGQFEKALTIIEEDQNIVPLFLPEFLRLKAKAVKSTRPEDAEEMLRTAWNQAGKGGNALWKLRICMEQIQLQQERKISFSHLIPMLDETVAAFSGEYEMMEVTNARKHLLALKESIG
jgi:class 3 adenylate cyclase/tetratricopeptide (TPR) repeat protein